MGKKCSEFPPTLPTPTPSSLVVSREQQFLPHPTQALQMFQKSSFRVRIHLQPLGFSAQLQPLAQSLGLKGDNSGDVPQNKGRARREGFMPPRAHPLLKILPWPLQSQRQTTQVLQH